MNYLWKKKAGQFQSGSNIYLNGILLGGFGWNSSRPQSGTHENNHWAGGVYLPSLNTKTLLSGTEGEMKEKIENLANSWFDKILKS